MNAFEYEKDNIRYKKPIRFHIPAIFVKELIFPFQSSIYNIITQDNLKRENVNYIVYGCPCSCTWNGGRYITYPTYKIEVLYEMFFNFINNLGMDIQITFTNSLLEERDTYDRLGNAILKVCESFKDNCEILITSPILEEYIRNEYPSIKIARSMVKLTKPIREDFEKYSTIVVPKWQNHDMEYLKSIKEKDKIELLVDEPCIINCPRKKTHYEAYNKSQLFIEHNDIEFCDNNNRVVYNELMILPEEINDYIDLGIRHFKLSGRENIISMKQSIQDYCIKKQSYTYFDGCFLKILTEKGYCDYHG